MMKLFDERQQQIRARGILLAFWLLIGFLAATYFGDLLFNYTLFATTDTMLYSIVLTTLLLLVEYLLLQDAFMEMRADAVQKSMWVFATSFFALTASGVLFGRLLASDFHPIRHGQLTGDAALIVITLLSTLLFVTSLYKLLEKRFVQSLPISFRLYLLASYASILLGILLNVPLGADAFNVSFLLTSGLFLGICGFVLPPQKRLAATVLLLLTILWQGYLILHFLLGFHNPFWGN